MLVRLGESIISFLLRKISPHLAAEDENHGQGVSDFAWSPPLSEQEMSATPSMLFSSEVGLKTNKKRSYEDLIEPETSAGHSNVDIPGTHTARNESPRYEQAIAVPLETKPEPPDLTAKVDALMDDVDCISPAAVGAVFNLLQVKSSDVFLELGSGNGNVAMQATSTRGCEARGIDIMRSHVVGSLNNIKNKVEPRPGKVIKAFANNFGNWRTDCDQGIVLDDAVSGLFASMPPGSILVTLHPLRLGMSREETNACRKKHDLSAVKDASFFTVEQIPIGVARECLSWTSSDSQVIGYKYTRLAQEELDEAMFLCCNVNCQHSKSATFLPATRREPDGVVRMNVCSCKVEPPYLRVRRRPK